MNSKNNYFTIPNIITLSRLILLPFIVYGVLKDNKILAFSLTVIAFISDALDGFLARRMNLESNTGKILDHLIDKIFLNTLLFFLVYKSYLPQFYFYIIIIRDILILLGSLLLVSKDGTVYSSGILGKIAGFAFCITILSSIFQLNLITIPWMYISIFFSIASLIKYGIIFFKSI